MRPRLARRPPFIAFCSKPAKSRGGGVRKTPPTFKASRDGKKRVGQGRTDSGRLARVKPPKRARKAPKRPEPRRGPQAVGGTPPAPSAGLGSGPPTDEGPKNRHARLRFYGLGSSVFTGPDWRVPTFFPRGFLDTRHPVGTIPGVAGFEGGGPAGKKAPAARTQGHQRGGNIPAACGVRAQKPSSPPPTPSGPRPWGPPPPHNPSIQRLRSPPAGSSPIPNGLILGGQAFGGPGLDFAFRGRDDFRPPHPRSRAPPPPGLEHSSLHSGPRLPFLLRWGSVHLHCHSFATAIRSESVMEV
jgi:hypothetical protein